MNGYGRGQDNGKQEALSSVITRETLGMTLLLFSAILLVIAIIGSVMLGEIGVAITAFLMGIFGYFTYPVLVFSILVSLKMITGKKIFSWKWALRIGCVLVPVFFIVHLSTSARFFGAGYGAYLNGCWHAADVSVRGATGGGAIFGLLAYPMRALLSAVGAYIIFSLLTALALFFLLLATPAKQAFKRSARPSAKSPRPAEQRADEAQRPSYEPQRAEAEYAQPEYRQPEYGQANYTQPEYRQPDYRQPEYGQVQREERPAARGSVYNPPHSEQFDRYTPPMESPSSHPNDARDFLFGADPAASYRNNLAYSRDSLFNNRVRKSSVEPFPPVVPARRPSAVYSEDYSAKAQEPRPQMPRKIVEQTPSSPSLNYVRPSYKAPDVPKAEEPVDFYANDVQSSAPNVRDIPGEPAFAPAPEPVPEPAPAREDPFTRTVREDPFTRTEREDPFSRTEREDPFSRTEREDPFSRTEREDPFSRTEREDPFSRTEKEDPFSRTEREDPFSRTEREDPFSRTEKEDPFSRTEREEPFSREEQEEPRETEPQDDAGESRALDGFRARADMFDDDEPEPLPVPVRREREPAAHPIPSTPAPKPIKHVYRPYCRPSLSVFKQYDESLTVGREEIEHNSQIIVDTLAGFRLDVEVMRVAVGPSVTRYDINIPQNVSVGAVTRTAETVAMRLHAINGVNMYSNNEQGLISIEVPNSVRATVGLRSILQSEEYLSDKPGALMFAIGKDLEGRSVCGNLTKMKHILVAGATGSGKSVCLNAMLISLLCKYSPEDLRLILIDPKKVEFAVYDGLPHLMINEIIADAQKAVTALNWAIKEMERRYELFEQKTRSGVVVRELDEYNSHLTGDEQKLPKIVIVVDELADLMAVAKKDIEERIQRLTQKARAAGLHLVIATQRPSVDVITGVIKGNLPTRMAFRVIQEVDSRTILDESGAQKLLGNGDMLYRTEGMFNCVRVQGAFLSSDEVQSVLNDIKANNEAYFDPEVADFINRTESDGPAADVDADSDGAVNAEYLRALNMVVKLGQASISLIQRRCSIGYNHAGKIIEWMELMGYISPFDGKAKARTVLLTKEEYESKYGPLD